MMHTYYFIYLFPEYILKNYDQGYRRRTTTQCLTHRSQHFEDDSELEDKLPYGIKITT